MDAKAEASVDDAVPEAPEQSVVLISAGANHSVALLCKPPLLLLCAVKPPCLALGFSSF